MALDHSFFTVNFFCFKGVFWLIWPNFKKAQTSSFSRTTLSLDKKYHILWQRSESYSKFLIIYRIFRKGIYYSQANTYHQYIKLKGRPIIKWKYTPCLVPFLIMLNRVSYLGLMFFFCPGFVNLNLKLYP